MRKVSYCKKNFTVGGKTQSVLQNVMEGGTMHAMEGGEGNEIMKGLHRDEAFDY